MQVNSTQSPIICVDIPQAKFKRFFPADIQQLLYRPLDPVDPLGEQMQIAQLQIRFIHASFHRLNAVLHPPQRIVDFVGDAGDETAEGRLFLALENLFAGGIELLLRVFQAPAQFAVMAGQRTDFIVFFRR